MAYVDVGNGVDPRVALYVPFEFEVDVPTWHGCGKATLHVVMVASRTGYPVVAETTWPLYEARGGRSISPVGLFDRTSVQVEVNRYDTARGATMTHPTGAGDQKAPVNGSAEAGKHDDGSVT